MLDALFGSWSELSTERKHLKKERFALRTYIGHFDLHSLVGVLILVGDDHLLSVAAHEQVALCQQVEEEGPHSENVALRSKSAALEDLRGHIAWCAALEIDFFFVIYFTGESQIRDADLELFFVHDKDVVRFYVPVNDALSVHQVQRKQKLGHYRPNLLLGEFLPLL